MMMNVKWGDKGLKLNSGPYYSQSNWTFYLFSLYF